MSATLIHLTYSASGKAALLMLRAQALKAARVRAKAAAKAAKAAAEAAANSGSPDVIVTNTNNNTDASAFPNPEVDSLTCAHQRAMAAVATIIQVCKCMEILQHLKTVDEYCTCGTLSSGYCMHSVAHHPPSTPSQEHLCPEYKDHSGV